MLPLKKNLQPGRREYFNHEKTTKSLGCVDWSREYTSSQSITNGVIAIFENVEEWDSIQKSGVVNWDPVDKKY